MNTVSRRQLLGAAAATGVMLSAPAVLGQSRPKVVVVGGGAGGATAARYIAKDSKGAIDVTLGASFRELRQIESEELADGLRIVNKGAHFLADGDTVTVLSQ